MGELNNEAVNAMKTSGKYLISASIISVKFGVKEFRAVAACICRLLHENAQLGRQSLKSLIAKGSKIEEIGVDFKTAEEKIAKGAKTEESNADEPVRKENEGMSWNKGMIKGFEKYADKYGINYSVLKDKSHEPPEYHVFFEGKDASIIYRCLQNYMNDQIQKKNKKPLMEKLNFFRRRSRDMDLDHKKERGDTLKDKVPEHENR